MSELTRREAIRRAAMSLTALGATGLVPAPLSREVGEMVHAAMQDDSGGAGASQAFLDHEWKLLRLLAETIVPADDRSGSALEAGAPGFIDLLSSNNDELRRILSSGMLWLDRESRRLYGAVFVEAAVEDRGALLDLLAAGVVEEDPGYEGIVESIEYAGLFHYTTEPAGELGPGIRFFSWVRRLVVDAFYTSPIGIADVEYQGNDFLRSFSVPQASLDYALRRSPFRATNSPYSPGAQPRDDRPPNSIRSFSASSSANQSSPAKATMALMKARACTARISSSERSSSSRILRTSPSSTSVTS